MVSMARPFLADAEFVRKAAEGRADEINTCIACNQACLDHTFSGKITSCLVNPRACHETELAIEPAATPQAPSPWWAPARRGWPSPSRRRNAAMRSRCSRPARPSAASSTSRAQMPGKEEFNETLRYFRRQLELQRVDVRLSTRVDAATLATGGWDEVVLATGVTPRTPPIEGIDHPKVLGYLDVLREHQPVGERVALIGAGGIGFDVAASLTQQGPSASLDPERFYAEWGIDPGYAHAGGLSPAHPEPAARAVHLLQRKSSKVGDGLGRTTGWIHRTELKARGVAMTPGVRYERIDDAGLHVQIDGQPQTLPGRHRGGVRRAGTAARAAGRAAGRGLHRAPDRRRR
jgi:2,4-dienoyl-CoA reductase (NADPH2)